MLMQYAIRPTQSSVDILGCVLNNITNLIASQGPSYSVYDINMNHRKKKPLIL